MLSDDGRVQQKLGYHPAVVRYGRLESLGQRLVVHVEICVPREDWADVLLDFLEDGRGSARSQSPCRRCGKPPTTTLQPPPLMSACKSAQVGILGGQPFGLVVHQVFEGLKAGPRGPPGPVEGPRSPRGVFSGGLGGFCGSGPGGFGVGLGLGRVGVDWLDLERLNILHSTRHRHGQLDGGNTWILWFIVFGY